MRRPEADIAGISHISGIPGTDMIGDRRKIADVGEKIGGARKDRWAGRGGLRLEDLAELTLAEREKFITKAEVWPEPDWKTLREEGSPAEVLVWIKLVRDRMAATPPFSAERPFS